MVKTIRRAARGVTSQASRTIVGVAVDSVVIIICFRVAVAGDTGEFRVV